MRFNYSRFNFIKRDSCWAQKRLRIVTFCLLKKVEKDWKKLATMVAFLLRRDAGATNLNRWLCDGSQT